VSVKNACLDVHRIAQGDAPLRRVSVQATSGGAPQAENTY